MGIMLKMPRPKCPKCGKGYLPKLAFGVGFHKTCRRCQKATSTEKGTLRKRVMEFAGRTERQYNRHHANCAICGSDISDKRKDTRFCRRHSASEIEVFRDGGLPAVEKYKKKIKRLKELRETQGMVMGDIDRNRNKEGTVIRAARIDRLRAAISPKNGWFHAKPLWREFRAREAICIRSFRGDLELLVELGELEIKGSMSGRKYRKTEKFRKGGM